MWICGEELKFDRSSSPSSFTAEMNNLLLRTGAILLHAIANFLLVNYLVNEFDLTGKWILFIGFILLLLVLLYLFVKHVVSYIYFLKTKTK